MLLLVTTISALGSDEQPHCIWRGICYRFPPDTEVSEDLYNCPYDGPPLPLEEDESKNVLLKFCPDIFKDRRFAALRVKMDHLLIASIFSF